MTPRLRHHKSFRALVNFVSMRRYQPLLLLLLAFALNCGGCGRSIVRMDNPLPIDAREYARIFDAAVIELRDQGFIINRHDYRFGVITTRPLAAPTLLEPWQRQNTTAYQGLESTLNSQRRTVTVTLELADTATSTDLRPATQPAVPGPAEVANTSAIISPLTASAVAGPAYQLRVEVLIERQQHPALQATGSPSGQEPGPSADGCAP